MVYKRGIYLLKLKDLFKGLRKKGEHNKKERNLHKTRVEPEQN